MSNELVLVTGGSGFIGAHCILHLLNTGYRVRTTIRSLKREPEVRAMLQQGGISEPDLQSPDRLSFIAADLESDTGVAPSRQRAANYVLHVASPFPCQQFLNTRMNSSSPRAKALFVCLRASRDAGVKRVVLTSSFAAIGYGQPAPASAPSTKPTGPTPTEKTSPPTSNPKTLAERAAWDFIASEGGNLELSVVNPVGVFGPVLGPDYSTSILIVQRMMDGAIPGCPSHSASAQSTSAT